MYCLFVEKTLVTIEIFLPDYFWGVKNGDKMAISAYILEKSRKGPIFKTTNQSLGYFQFMGFSRFYLTYTCTKFSKKLDKALE